MNDNNWLITKLEMMRPVFNRIVIIMIFIIIIIIISIAISVIWNSSRTLHVYTLVMIININWSVNMVGAPLTGRFQRSTATSHRYFFSDYYYYHICIIAETQMLTDKMNCMRVRAHNNIISY